MITDPKEVRERAIEQFAPLIDQMLTTPIGGNPEQSNKEETKND